jgi:putative protein-disulfide isomerase
MAMNNKHAEKIIEVIEFTDPVCTWFWGSEPILRKLETRYSDQLKIKFIMGGLVRDIREFYDSFNDIGGDPERSNKQIVEHWLEASKTHGMPVRSEGFNLFSNDYPSSFPQNIAYKAAQMESEEKANRFLRRLREATATEAKQTNRKEVLIGLASEVGLDIPKFIERLSNGSAEAAFEEDLKITKRYGAKGFPTFLLRYGEIEVLLKGYQSFDAFRSVIEIVTGDTIKEVIPDKSEKSVMEFIRKHIRVAPVEIQVSFDYSNKEVQAVIESLNARNLIEVIQAGNGSLIKLSNNPLSCDSNSGVCSI